MHSQIINNDVYALFVLFIADLLHNRFYGHFPSTYTIKLHEQSMTSKKFTVLKCDRIYDNG